MIKMYIIIVTFNGGNLVKNCLNSVITEGVPQERIIVFDNGSTDNTTSIIEKEYDEILLIKNIDNLGFGQANNISLKMALKLDATHFVLLNQDAYFRPDAIKKLLKTSVKNPSFGIITPMHLSFTGAALEHSFYSYISTHKDYWDALHIGKNIREIYDCSFVNAACWLVTKECIIEVGGFDPLFFHYGEDEDYCARTLKHRFRIGFCPQSHIVHERISVGTKKRNLVYLNFFNRKILELKASDLPLIRSMTKIFVKSLFCSIGHFITMDIRTARLEVFTAFRLLLNSLNIYKSKKQSRRKSAFLFP